MEGKKLVSVIYIMVGVIFSLQAESYGFISIFPNIWKWIGAIACLLVALFISVVTLIALKGKENVILPVDLKFTCWSLIISSIVGFVIFPTTFFSFWGLILGIVVSSFSAFYKKSYIISYVCFILLLLNLIPVTILFPQAWWKWKYFLLAIITSLFSNSLGTMINFERKKVYYVAGTVLTVSVILAVITCFSFYTIALILFILLLCCLLAISYIVGKNYYKRFLRFNLNNYQRIFNKTPKEIRHIIRTVPSITLNLSTKYSLSRMGSKINYAIYEYKNGKQTEAIDYLESFFSLKEDVNTNHIKGHKNKNLYKNFCKIGFDFAKELGYEYRIHDSHIDFQNEDDEYYEFEDEDLEDSNLKQENLDSLLESLDSLVGLHRVKTEIDSIINIMKLNLEREKKGLPKTEVALHLVFSGNPGTGKTTVARLLGKIYKEIGVLSIGKFIEVDRSSLVGAYVGWTEKNTKEKLKEAKGSILFIDEAYALTPPNSPSDFGYEAVNTILKKMEDTRNDFMVIVAGYPNEMESFINSNPGLASRFTTTIYFDDYNGDELYQIFTKMCKTKLLIIEDGLEHSLRSYFNQMYKNRGKNFANARDVRNFLENAIKRRDTRLGKLDLKKISNKEFQTLTKNDFDI